MGNCQSGLTPEDREAMAVTKQIDVQLKQDNEVSRQVVKLLLLGAGDTGKSTILKQMKLIHGIGFSNDERKAFKSAIMINIITSAKTLVKAMCQLKIPFGFDPGQIHDPQSQADNAYKGSCAEGLGRELGGDNTLGVSAMSIMAATIERNPVALAARNLYRKTEDENGKDTKQPACAKVIEACDVTFCFSDDITMPSDVYAAILEFWQDPGVKYCYSRSNEYQLLDACAYYLDNVERIAKPDYFPTDQDILSARILTTRVTEINFQVQDIPFKVFDLGGQRSERKKWVSYFDDVKAILFLVAISSYNQVCFEDNSTNRMVESMTLFGSICNHAAFRRTAMVVFMNKIDLFRSKLETCPISLYFPNFTGLCTYENASDFFSRQFVLLNKFPDKKIYVHYTWATDTNQITKVLSTVNHIILSANLDQSGL
ncbi:guanine nucleotide-binding protein alpha-1 subunit [Chytriomyces cf. hyalinus JEL632]|nr:guanine nucleotide-binding protein alpha-1 subunit [Chytriomyces cf. hyalinus JEL632]